jgi:hypothetical protein
MTGEGAWADAFAKAKTMVGKMTLAEKVSQFSADFRGCGTDLFGR